MPPHCSQSRAPPAPAPPSRPIRILSAILILVFSMYDAEEYLIRQAFRDALESKEAEDFLKKLAESPAEPEPRARDISPAEPVT